MSATLDIVGKNYYMMISTIHFVPCNLLTATPIIQNTEDIACLRIRASYITDLDESEILSIGDDSIEDYIDQSGNEDCVFVNDSIERMLQLATANKQPQSDHGLVLFMESTIVHAIKKAGTRNVEEELKSWIYVVVTPNDWGKRVTSNALFALLSKSSLISPSSTLVITAFETLLNISLLTELRASYGPLYNSRNLLCELSVGKNGDVCLSTNMFSTTKTKESQNDNTYNTVDPFLTKPTVFFNNRIQMNVGYRGLVALIRNTVDEEIGSSLLYCNEVLSGLCLFLCALEEDDQEQGSKRLNQIYPFQNCMFSSVATRQDVSALRLMTLQDVYNVLSPQLEPILLEIQAAIKDGLFITRVCFTVIPDVPSIFPEHYEDTLFICTMLLKFSLQKGNAKEFQYLYDKNKRYYGASMASCDSIDEHIKNTSLGASLNMMQKLATIYQELPPLSSLVDTMRDTGSIDTINYVYLSTSQVLTQSVNVHENGTIRKVSTQNLEFITLDQFLVMNDSESRFDETTLQFHISQSTLLSLESMFSKSLLEFATLYRRPFPVEDAACMPILDLEKWFHSLYKKCEQFFLSEASESSLNYTEIMTDLANRQSNSYSPRIYMTQQKHIGVFLMVYFGYLKEMLAKDFGQDSDSTRYILIFEHLMRNATIGQKDDTLMRMALDQCGWIPEAAENKKKLMIYDIEDSFPVSKSLQKENVKKIPAKKYYAVVTMTRYYVKTYLYQALEDILPTDKYCKAIKGANFTHQIDFYEMVCERIWQHVLESAYNTDTLLEHPSSVDIMDIDFSLQTYKSFKKAFMKYILSTFPFTYASHPDEKHQFLMQKNCSIVLTNRLVLQSGVLPALKSFMGLTSDLTQSMDFVFYRPSNFDDQENLSLPMLKLIEAEMKKMLAIRFERLIWDSERQFGFVHSHRYLNPIIGDTAFGYDALKKGVIRGIQADTFAINFQYADENEESFVEVVTGRPSPSQIIQRFDGCIISKAGAPYDNISMQLNESDLVLKFPDLTSVLNIRIVKIHNDYHGNIGDIVSLRDHSCTVVTYAEMRNLIFEGDFERFSTYPFVHLYLKHNLSGYNNSVTLHSIALDRPLERMDIIHPMKVAYFDSYEVRL